MRTILILTLLVMVLGTISACALVHRPDVLPIWFRNAPTDWTPPAPFAKCHIRDEVVLEDGSPNGRDTIRIDCPDRTVLVDKQTKRVVWERPW